MPGPLEFYPFDFDFGLGQGRTEPDNFAQDGDYALVLGHDRPRTGVYLRVGNFVSVWQNADIGATKVLKFRLRTRGTEFMPGDTKWVFSVWIDGAEKPSTRRIAAVSKTVDYADVAVNLAGLAGAHSIALVLTLEE